MTRQYFKTAKQVANYLNKIAEYYGFVYETTLIQNDMKAYAGDVLEWADVMKKEKSYFNYSRTFWIRRQGVESTKERAEYFGGTKTRNNTPLSSRMFSNNWVFNKIILCDSR